MIDNETLLIKWKREKTILRQTQRCNKENYTTGVKREEENSNQVALVNTQKTR